MKHFTDPGKGGKLPKITRAHVLTNYSGQRVEGVCPMCGERTDSNSYDGFGVCRVHGLVNLPQWNPEAAA